MDAGKVSCRQAVLRFLKGLRQELVENPQTWENRRLEDYLEAMHRWAEDMEGYYRNTGQELPSQVSWRVLANILRAASIYE